MPVDVHRTGPGSLVGQEFYEIEEFGAYSFCPDSNDASTPAKQVHVQIRLKSPLFRKRPPPMVMRMRTAEMVDAFIESLIEHRTYTFGRRTWDATKYQEQESLRK